MKRILNMGGLLATLSVLFFSCQKDLSHKDEIKDLLGKKKSTNATMLQTTSPCGEPMVKSLEDMSGFGSWGTIKISNDQDYIIVQINSELPGMYLGKVTLSYGSEQDVMDDLSFEHFWTACEGPKKFDLQKTWPPITVTSDTVRIPVSNFQEDGCIWLSVSVELNGDHGTLGCAYASPYDVQIGSGQWQNAFKYCRQDCPPEEECGQLRTQTPGGWGAEPHGNNPGTYLHANFAAAFPNGLAIGCYPNNYFVRVTSAQAITDLLPTGGKAVVLTANSTNPAEIKNVLVGHLIALTLAVGFDAYDPNFGQAGVKLGDMKIKSGKFENWTVAAFLAEANKVIGGCGGTYKIEDVLPVADDINNNYDNGNVDKGFLVCPTIR